MSHKFLSLGMISTGYFYDEHADLSTYHAVYHHPSSLSVMAFSHGFHGSSQSSFKVGFIDGTVSSLQYE